MGRALEALVRFYRTGQHRCSAGVRRRVGRRIVSLLVDTINGFVEIYMDARGRKGAWKLSRVLLCIREKTAADRTASPSTRSGSRIGMPWHPRYRKPRCHGCDRTGDRDRDRDGRRRARDARR